MNPRRRNLERRNLGNTSNKNAGNNTGEISAKVLAEIWGNSVIIPKKISGKNSERNSLKILGEILARIL